MGWLKYSPSDFVFTAKLPKTITHDKALGLKKDVKADLDVFSDLLLPLQLWETRLPINPVAPKIFLQPSEP